MLLIWSHLKSLVKASTDFSKNRNDLTPATMKTSSQNASDISRGGNGPHTPITEINENLASHFKGEQDQAKK